MGLGTFWFQLGKQRWEHCKAKSKAVLASSLISAVPDRTGNILGKGVGQEFLDWGCSDTWRVATLGQLSWLKSMLFLCQAAVLTRVFNLCLMAMQGTTFLPIRPAYNHSLWFRQTCPSYEAVPNGGVRSVGQVLPWTLLDAKAWTVSIERKASFFFCFVLFQQQLHLAFRLATSDPLLVYKHWSPLGSSPDPLTASEWQRWHLE